MEQEGRDEKGRWGPGVSGNPNGRPPSGQAQSDLLRKKSDEIDFDTGLPNREIITNKIIALAKDGVPWAVKEWYDRVEGKPTQSLEHTVYQEENPLVEVLQQIIDGTEQETD